ncbi:hypothetical protein OIDMADRAFT_108106 [Oidiodendron maius Zn]|uniref:Transposase Tc1-like domain-containing protein n=1 Tax=Oidiodendron maius (strain Zn) TaxID=913774 RepID=A0A0C3HJC7_OIDMZ|nr:hypothetical protein OIDMADRAFT_108106 [Oidiodendron maius Zn]
MPRPPNIPRPPLYKVSPNSRSRVVAAYEYGIKFTNIARGENLRPGTCRQIVLNTSIQTSCISRLRSGRPELITPRLGRQLFRAIAINPKITAAQLHVAIAPKISKITIYRYLKKSSIQKWRYKKRPLLDDKKAAICL